MAVPTVPTIATILTEALTRSGTPSPTTDQLARAEDEWLEEIKQDILGRKNLRSLQETIVLIPIAYVTVYAIPSPLYTVNELWFYRGDETGTAQAGTSNTITLAAASTASEDDVRARKIYLTGGTGAGQSNRITALNTSTKVATVACAWTTNPDSTTTYMVEDEEHLIHGPDQDIPRDGQSPSTRILRWEFWEDHVHIHPPLDNAGEYALELRGTVDLSLVDETDARYTRFLREWRNAIKYGVMVRNFEDVDDDNALRYEGKYERAVNRLLQADTRKAQRYGTTQMRSLGGLPRRRR